MCRKPNRLYKRPIGYKKGHDPTVTTVINQLQTSVVLKNFHRKIQENKGVFSE